ncbi:hypothetical protein Tco_0773238 [Tanacetum coccineum]|uniref:Uncharacterized protein n=1 Tax=Tanacetum coccineum TaxID=301880 RepID=A0ABQ4ZL62_9ASTR
MSTLVFVDLESSTQADEAQSFRVPVPLPKDPYKAIRQAYLDGTDTESEHFKDPIDTETPESPLTVIPPTSLPESTSLVFVPILRRTACIAVRVPPVMSSGLSASMAEVAAMFKSAFRKRFRSSYETSSSLSPTDLLARKRYRGTFELVEDSEEDEEIVENLDSDSVSQDAEDEGPTTEDEDPTAGDEGLAAGVEVPGTNDESYGLDDESHGMDDESRGLGDEDHNVKSDRLSVSAPLGVGYGALRRRELALEEDYVYSTFKVGHCSGSAQKSKRPERVSASRQPSLTTWIDPKDSTVYIDVPTYPPPPPVQTPPLPEWMSGSLPISPSPSVVPSLVLSPMISLTGGLIRDHAVRLEDLSPALFERYDKDIGELFTRSGAVKDEIFSQRPVLALESWAGQTDAQRSALWHAISDMQGENRDLRLQLVEERRARLELVMVVDGMRRGQEP